MTQINAEIVADSLSPQGHRITSMLLTYPRIIHAEMCRHRMHSRNSASSRAIPFEKMVQQVQENPFIPIAWQKDHKGMNGTEYAEYPDIEDFKSIWLNARNDSVKSVQLMHTGNVKLTKQLCNRILEPFMWHKELVTATEWDNFFELRCPKYRVCHATVPYRSRKDAIKDFGKSHPYIKEYTDLDWLKMSYSGAEIHMQLLAEKMWDAMNESKPQELGEGKWHIPFGDQINNVGHFTSKVDVNNTFWKDYNEQNKIKIAVARAARLSYTTHNGEIDYEKDIELHDRLFEKKHMSPFEHVAKAMNKGEYEAFLKGNVDPGFDVPENNLGWCRNFHGWIPYRYLIENQ